MWTKLIGQALLPLDLAIEAALLALLLRRLGRRRTSNGFFAFGLLWLWGASTPVVADALVRALESRHAPISIDATPTADAIVVLGGALGPARPPRLAADLSEAADRVLHAARLFRAGKAPLVIATGGAAPGGASSAPESGEMADLLVEWGVARAAIVEEGASLDTHENAVETKRLLDSRGLSKVLLVTSALHMPRALATFRAAGVDAVACPTDFLSIDPEHRTLLDWLPDAEALAHSSAAVHEWVGGVWYGIRGWE